MFVDLRGLSLRNVRLAHAMLPYVDLSYSTFEVCNLEDICLQGSRLDWVGFHKCNLKRADLLQVMANHSTFERCAMDDAVLIDGDFRLAQVNNVRMPRALMDGADLRDSQLKEVSLAGAKMLDTQFPTGFDLQTALQPLSNGLEPT
ncbi:pentapeptide repeat-containing protein [Pseudomonas viridiflava]|uniref:pentapeptide repeat-containing protein n=1 Tax=Pseudomonas viridiflava TaxID=33069 RepID=UPI002EB1EE18|nr:pentapeptide repeat-containing protein [Pseudomonas viridiflava]